MELDAETLAELHGGWSRYYDTDEPGDDGCFHTQPSFLDDDPEEARWE